MERPPNFKRIIGVVKKIDNNYYGIGDGLGNFAFLTNKFIVGMHPTNPLMWQKTIFLLDSTYKVTWKEESTKFFNSYDYQTKTIDIPKPIPAEFLEVIPPQPRSTIPSQQPIPQQPVQLPLMNSSNISIPGITQLPPPDYLPQITARLDNITQILIEQRDLLNAIYKQMIYTKTPNIPDTTPPSKTDDGMKMKDFFNKYPEKLDEEVKSSSSKKSVPEINW